MDYYYKYTPKKKGVLCILVLHMLKFRKIKLKIALISFSKINKYSAKKVPNMSHRYVHNIAFPPPSTVMHDAPTTSKMYPINLTLLKVELSQLANAGKGEVLPRSYFGNVQCSNSFFLGDTPIKMAPWGTGIKNTIARWPTTN